MANFFQLFESYFEKMLVFNELIADSKTIFGADGLHDGKAKASGTWIVAFFVEGLEHGFVVQGFFYTRIADA